MKAKIGIFGRVNSGKSTLLNRLTSQSIAIVSAQRGTTTDPVRRAYELLDYGAITFIDTAGFDDNSPLGEQRVAKTNAVLSEVDAAIFITDKEVGFDAQEEAFIDRMDAPTIVVRWGYDTEKVLDELRSMLKLKVKVLPPFYGDRLKNGDTVILVCPIDSEAPNGRLILPQVMAIRAALDINAMAIVVQPSELSMTIDRINADLVVTDSQAFSEVLEVVPSGVEVTSFSILLAHQRGDAKLYESGLSAIKSFTKGQKLLLIEHCSHGVSCDDIGRVKIPAMLSKKLGFDIEFDMVSGREPLPADLDSYGLAVQCGGCMVGSVPIMHRARVAKERGLPITNYGMLLRYLNEQ